MAKKPETKRGRGRPKLAGGASVVVAVSLPGDVAEALDAYVEAKGGTKSAAVTEALRVMLKRKKR